MTTVAKTFGSEVFYSLGKASEAIKLISSIMPLKYFLEAVRSALYGDPSTAVVPSLVLAGFTLLFLALASATFRWDQDQSLGVHLHQIF